MRLTILGNGPVSPNPGGASSGYLVQSGNASLLLDCGSGVIATPAFRAALPELDSVLISHLHIDHWLDLATLAYELKYAPHQARLDPLPVLTPPGQADKLLDLFSALMHGSRHAEEVFQIREYDPQTTLRIGDTTVSFRQVEHYIPAYAMRVEAEGKAVAYSGDSAACESLVSLAQNADLLLCEATDPVEAAHHGPRGHMSALEAGEIASRAKVKHLLLTHFWHQYDTHAMLKAAQSVYSGVCELAEQGKSYEV